MDFSILNNNANNTNGGIINLILINNKTYDDKSTYPVPSEVLHLASAAVLATYTTKYLAAGAAGLTAKFPSVDMSGSEIVPQQVKPIEGHSSYKQDHIATVAAAASSLSSRSSSPALDLPKSKTNDVKPSIPEKSNNNNHKDYGTGRRHKSRKSCKPQPVQLSKPKIRKSKFEPPAPVLDLAELKEFIRSEIEKSLDRKSVV